jgi:hypothetical protein
MLLFVESEDSIEKLTARMIERKLLEKNALFTKEEIHHLRNLVVVVTDGANRLNSILKSDDGRTKFYVPQVSAESCVLPSNM